MVKNNKPENYVTTEIKPGNPPVELEITPSDRLGSLTPYIHDGAFVVLGKSPSEAEIPKSIDEINAYLKVPELPEEVNVLIGVFPEGARFRMLGDSTAQLVVWDYTTGKYAYLLDSEPVGSKFWKDNFTEGNTGADIVFENDQVIRLRLLV